MTVFGFVNETENSNEIWGFYFIVVNKYWFVTMEEHGISHLYYASTEILALILLYVMQFAFMKEKHSYMRERPANI